MSSAVISTSAALGRPFVFDGQADDESEPEVCSPPSASRAALDRTAEGGCPHINQESPLSRVQSAIRNQTSKISPKSVTSASRLEIRPAPEMVSSGIPAIDALTGGLPRGCLTEVCGPASSGRTTLLMATLAAATRRGEFCAVVDASDTLDPKSAAAAGVELERLLWVRCGCPELVERVGISSVRVKRTPSQSVFDFERTKSERTSSKKNVLNENNWRQAEHRLEQVLRATDLLLESGGFGLIVLDLGDLPAQAARRIPLTTWFRFRRAIEHTPTILLAIEQQAIAGSCSSLLLQLEGATDESAAGRRKKINSAPSENPVHAQLFTGLNITAELVRSRLDRKSARSVAFATKTAWAG
jgi:hypothetical protein